MAYIHVLGRKLVNGHVPKGPPLQPRPGSHLRGTQSGGEKQAQRVASEASLGGRPCKTLFAAPE